MAASVKAAANSGAEMRGDKQYAVGDFTAGTSKAVGQYASENKERLGGAGGASIGMLAGAALLGPIGLVAGSLLGSSVGQASMRIGKRGQDKSESAGTENTRSAPEARGSRLSQEKPYDLLSEPMDSAPSRATRRNIPPPNQAFQQAGMSAYNPSWMTSFPSQHGQSSAAANSQSAHPLAPNLLENVIVEAGPAELITDLYSVPSYPIANVEAISTQPILASPNPLSQVPAPTSSQQTIHYAMPQPNMYQQGPISQSPQAYAPTMHPQQPYCQNQPPQTGYAQSGAARAPPYYQNQPPQNGSAQAGVARAPVANPPHQMRQEHHPQNPEQGYHFGK